jgi:hypothetical protein
MSSMHGIRRGEVFNFYHLNKCVEDKPVGQYWLLVGTLLANDDTVIS